MSKVFISYAHSSQEHKRSISELVATLRKSGLIVFVDTDVKTPQGPEEGWPRWMKTQIKDADWVLMFFDDLYRKRFDGDEEPGIGLGATWEWFQKVPGDHLLHGWLKDQRRNLQQQYPRPGFRQHPRTR